ncbi:MAG: ABC transporter ATP-binding protein [Thermodesulfobacteriota bacterium]
MLELKNIHSYYGTIQALFGIDIEIHAGEMVSLLGRNGMGKTTTVRSILGLTRPRQGTVTFQGRDIFGAPSYRIAQMGIGLVPEGRQIFPTLTVRENLVATAYRGKNGRRPWTPADIYELFPVLAQRTRQPGSRLSGGEQQMLAIGRALMTHPKLLILDEATEGLEPTVRAQIWDCLENLKSAGLSILVIDIHLDALTRICDRHYIIEKGRIVWRGDSSELKADPAVRQNYLGV